MNIFVPQSVQTQIELENIADVKRQFITPKASVPIIGVIQDSLLGSYNLTAPNMSVKWQDAMNIISYASIDDLTQVKKGKDYSGTDIFSLIIPPKISMDSSTLKVTNGHISEGRVFKDQLGSMKKNGFIHLILDEYGIDEAKRFLDNTQRLIMNFNLLNGFTVGIGDIYIPDELLVNMQKLFETTKLEIDHTITEMENNPDMLDEELFERTVYGKLNAIKDDVSKLIINNMDPLNNFNVMLKSGSKGGESNIGQMGGCIGQVAVEGNRIQKKFNNRSLPYFPQHDDSALARGFVQESFMTGMSPEGFIFHNMGSREGLIDTAIKTAASGYIQRKLIKTMEDAMVKYDSTVRNGSNTILQFTYGDNGIDTTKQHSHNLNILKMGNKEVADKYKFTKQELQNYSSLSSKWNDEYYNMLLSMRDNIRDSRMKIALNYITFETDYMLPVNMIRIINNIKNSSLDSKEKLDPMYIYNKLNEILEYKNTQVLAMGKVDSDNKDSLKYKDDLVSKTVFKLALHEFLAPKVCIFDLKLNKAKFDEICKLIISSFNKATVEPGEMIGVVAAQSIGEPVTQLSVARDTPIIAMIDDGKNKEVTQSEIGDFIDDLLKNSCSNIQKLGKDSVASKPDIDVHIMTVNTDNEKTEWKKVTEISLHLMVKWFVL
jgi:DNA-directed RNA polymerase II subunit RPB1